MIRIQHRPSRSQLVVFGLMWLVFFGILGIISFRQPGGSGRAVAFWMLAVAVPLAGLLCPEILRRTYVLASYATFPIGWILSLIALMVIYYFVLTPVGLVLRLAGYDSMRRRFDPDARTYWLPRETDDDAERYFRQF